MVFFLLLLLNCCFLTLSLKLVDFGVILSCSAPSLLAFSHLLPLTAIPNSLKQLWALCHWDPASLSSFVTQPLSPLSPLTCAPHPHLLALPHTERPTCDTTCSPVLEEIPVLAQAWGEAVSETKLRTLGA